MATMNKGFRIDLTGKRFSRLRVLGYSHNHNNGSFWKCKCDCGKTKITSLNNLRQGHTKSCGCFARDTVVKINKSRATHNETKTKFYVVWRNMRNRCLSKKSNQFKNYGGRGIKICKKWEKFENFKRDMLPTYKEGLSLDRINNNGNYSPSNCRWATIKTQSQNKRINKKYKGVCISEHSRRLGGHRDLVHRRLKLGWTLKRACETPMKDIKLYNGKRLSEWSKISGINYRTLWGKVVNEGQDLKKVLLKDGA